MRRQVLLAVASAGALAMGASAAQAAPDTGQLLLEARLRFEHYEADGPDAEGVTERLRVGWRQPISRTLTGLIEVEAVGAFEHDYADGVHPAPGKATIPDPAIVELNRAQLEWRPSDKLSVDLGRQRIILGNSRFVGNSAWRQNEQTFDAVRLTAQPTKAVTLTYIYADRVNRSLGRKSAQGVWRGDVHVVQAESELGALGKGTAYALLLDFDNAATQSSKTFGVRLAGARPIGGGFSGTWELEYAHQNDWGSNPQRYSLDYQLAGLGLKTKRSSVSANLERLEGDGVHGFQTPLASLHPFQGWSDVIGVTPAKGVRDVFLRGVTSFGTVHPVRLTAEAHDFATTVGSQKLGREVDCAIQTTLAKGWSFEVGVGRFDSRGPTYPDATRTWASLDFKL